MVCQEENANHNNSGWFQDHNVRMVDWLNTILFNTQINILDDDIQV